MLAVGLAAAVLSTAVAGSAGAAPAGRDGSVGEWIDRTAVPLATTDPREPLDDLRALRRMVGAAPVVGLGESTHGSREQFRVKHRMVRFLVERMGFRTVAFEQDFAGGVLIDRYVVTGEGDPRALVAVTDTIGWWHRIAGGRIAHWAANAHTAAAPAVTFRWPSGTARGTFAGGYLRERLGRRYVSIGGVFHHGVITSDYTRSGPTPGRAAAARNS